MKKYVYIGIVLQIFITIFILISVEGKIEFNRLLYKDKNRVLVIPQISNDEEVIKYQRLNVEKQAKFILKSAEENEMEISKYIFANDKKVTVYTNDLEQKGRIKWKDKEVRKELKNNEKKEIDMHCGEDFVWTDKEMDVTIKDFVKSSYAGNFGLYYMKFKNPDKINNFINDMKKFNATVEYTKSNDYYMRTLEDIFANYYLIYMWLIMFIVNIAIMMQYLLKNGNKIMLLKMFGWSNKEILRSYTVKFIKLSGIVSIISFILVISYYYLRYGGFNLIGLFFIVLLINFISTIIAYVILCKIMIFISLKEKSYINLGIGINIVSKLCIASVAIILGISSINTIGEIKKYKEQQKHWDKFKDIYIIELKFITNDYKKYRPYQVKLKKFYDKAMKDKNLILMSCENYKFEGDEIPLRKLNTHSELEELISPAGKSVVINTNYLKYNPIVDENGEDPVKKIIYDDKVMNVFVPVALKKYEDELKKYYLHRFDFDKNLFAEEFGFEVVKDLKLNIIYVKDNQKYFSYSYSVGTDDFTIKDPVAIVDTGNLDVTCYGSWLSNSTFVESKEKDGYSYILEDVIETDNMVSIQNTTCTYDFMAEQFNRKKDLLTTLLTTEILLICIFISNIYFSYQLIIDRYKYRIYIKKIFGYSYIELFSMLVISQLLLSLITGCYIYFLKRNHLVINLTFIWIIFEILVTVVSLLYLKNDIRNFSLSKKGEKND